MIKLNFKKVRQEHFPDGSLHLMVGENDIYLTSENIIQWEYKDDSELFTLICLKRMIDEKVALNRSNKGISLILPYIPHARMDRVEDDTTAFTLKYFCEVINSLHFNSVYLTDPHSNVAVALLDRCIAHYTSDVTIDDVVDFIYDKDKVILFYPDEGAMKRYSKHITEYPYTFGIKHRDWETGKITSYKVAEPSAVEGKKVLIVDDICSKGGTFTHAADALSEAGAASIYLYVTHLEPTVFQGKLLNDDSLVKHIFTKHTLDTTGTELEFTPKITYI